MRLPAVLLSRHGVVLWIVCMFAASAWAADGVVMPPSGNARDQTPAPETTGQFFSFDIPAQPLAAALNHYASITERAALFRSEVVAGRMSSAVSGRYTPEAALAMLLEGTGLVAERTRTGPVEAFALKVLAQPAPSIPAAWAGAGDYPGLVQARLWQVLCDGIRTAPGRYRALLRFHVDAVGGVQRVQLLGSTGDTGRDTAMLEALGRVRMDAPPPAGMLQPMTMLILPSERGGSPDAASGSACAARNAAVS